MFDVVPSHRRTKIVATIGPASRDDDSVRKLIAAGIDVARLNLAHGAADEHAATAATLRREARSAGRTVGLLADIPGPKMRTGAIEGGEVLLRAGERLVLTGRNDAEGDSERISTSLDDVSEVVDAGDEIHLADGAIVLRVTSSRKGDVTTEVVRGGVLRSRKGMHIPGAEKRVQAFTNADRHALDLAVNMGVNFVGLSFVRDGKDVRRVRNALENEAHRPLLVAKIETRTAVERLDEIIDESDAVMVARGDLGIQTPIERVPVLQKEIIHCCNRAGVPVITATQMLESMTRAPMPTRAEVADVANAVIDGSDALMLSEETAVGDYPVDAVKTMAETAVHAESYPSECDAPQQKELDDDPVAWAIARAAVGAAEDLNVAAIVCPTRSGATARRVAAFRPSIPIVALAAEPDVAGALALLWGVLPLTGDSQEEYSNAEAAVRVVRDAALVQAGSLVAVVAGAAGRRTGSTDYVRILRA
jgi:pyruvate kinase